MGALRVFPRSVMVPYQVGALSDHPIRFAAAERSVNDIKTFVSLFTADGAILDVVSATEYATRTLVAWLTSLRPHFRTCTGTFTTSMRPATGDRRDAEHQIMRSLAEGSGETPQVLCCASV